jgi:hypothetical protein
MLQEGDGHRSSQQGETDFLFLHIFFLSRMIHLKKGGPSRRPYNHSCSCNSYNVP